MREKFDVETKEQREACRDFAAWIYGRILSDRARYQLALCQRSELDAINEARALATGAERDLWLALAREARQDARRWMRALREANETLTCNA